MHDALWHVAFASACVSKPQVAGQGKQVQEKTSQTGHLQGFLLLCWPYLSWGHYGPCCCRGLQSCISISCSTHTISPLKSPLLPCISQFLLCSRLSSPLCIPEAPLPLLLFAFTLSVAWETWTDARLGCPLRSTAYLGKDHFPIFEKGHFPTSPHRFTLNPSASGSKAKLAFAKPLSSFYRFFQQFKRVFLCYSRVTHLMAFQHCHYKPELFRCLLLSFKNWLYAEIWQTKCQPRREFHFCQFCALKGKKKTPFCPP